MDSGTIQNYFAPDAPIANFDPSAPPVHVGTATVSVQRFCGTAEIALPSLPTYIPRSGQVMPSFAHTLVGIGRFWDADFTVTFDKDAVTLANPAGLPIIMFWRESRGSRL